MMIVILQKKILKQLQEKEVYKPGILSVSKELYQDLYQEKQVYTLTLC